MLFAATTTDAMLQAPCYLLLQICLNCHFKSCCCHGRRQLNLLAGNTIIRLRWSLLAGLSFMAI